jgi:hypothetical protein
MNTGRRAATATVPRPERPIEKRSDAAERPSLRIIARPAQRRRRVGALAITGSVLVFGFMIGLAGFQAQLARNQLQVDSVELDLKDAELAFERNRAELARLESPQRIISEAAKLGLQQPTGRTRYLTPSAAVVTEVLVSAGGGPTGAVAGDTQTRPDWSAYKNATGRGVVVPDPSKQAPTDAESNGGAST